MTVTFQEHRDGSWTVTMRYPWQDDNRRHKVVKEGERGRLWCTRCESQCGATIHLANHLKGSQ